MNIPPLSDPTVLSNATPAQLELAAADNHRQLFTLEAMALNGEVQAAGGLSWTYAGPDRNAAIPFPILSKDDAGKMLDAMMAWYRNHPPKGAGCWSLHPPQPADLGVRLLARGFQPGWQPSWMALRLADMNDRYPAPAGLEIVPDNDTDTATVSELPYAGNKGAVPPLLTRAFPGRAQRFLAIMNGNIVGQTCVFFTTGNYGVAGIYNQGVVPEVRLQGIGKAVLLAALRYALRKGYHYAVLNGTGRRMYEQVGFRWIGFGHTWWLNNRGYITHPPSAERIMLAEAVGLGDMAALNSIGKGLTPGELNTPLANDMTLIELAVYWRQPSAAEWLVKHGAAYNVLEAWDLGWKDRAAALLSTRPEEVNRRYSYLQSTILHTAAERNDIALAALALSAKPDLKIRDKIYHATPLDWAHHFGRTEIIELIKQHNVS